LKISVITAAFNSATTISDTLLSVASQSYSDFEHIIVDGQSRDDTVETVKAHWHSRLVINSEPDEGIYDAMNKGLKIAQGEIMGFLNADDLFADSEVLARVSKAFKDPDVDVCFGDLVYVTQDMCRVVRFWKSGPYKRGSFTRGWSPAHPTFYIRRSALERLGFFDLNYTLAADTEFMMRYLETGSLRCLYIPHIQVRMRVGGATNRSFKNILRQNCEIFNALKKNALAYHLVLFWFHKIVNRIGQRFAAMRSK